MDWRGFVHDHAIVVLIGSGIAFMLLGTIVVASLPARHHILRGAFIAFTWLAMALCSGIILLSLNIVPDMGIAGKDTQLAVLASLLLAIIILLWRIGSWWALHRDQESTKLAQKLKDAGSKVTVTLAAHKPGQDGKH